MLITNMTKYIEWYGAIFAVPYPHKLHESCRTPPSSSGFPVTETVWFVMLIWIRTTSTYVMQHASILNVKKTFLNWNSGVDGYVVVLRWVLLTLDWCINEIKSYVNLRMDSEVLGSLAGLLSKQYGEFMPCVWCFSKTM